MASYAYTATITEIANTDWFMPGLSLGGAVSGTLENNPEPGSPPMLRAVLAIVAGSHTVTATSVGLDPIAAFASHTPTGPLSSATVQHGGYIDNAFFEVTLSPTALGTVGFTIMGPGPDGKTLAGHVTAVLESVKAAKKPKPASPSGVRITD